MAGVGRHQDLGVAGECLLDLLPRPDATKRGSEANTPLVQAVQAADFSSGVAQIVDMQIVEPPPQTLLHGDVLDDSHLQGIIAQFEAVGIVVVSVLPVPEKG